MQDLNGEVSKYLNLYFMKQYALIQLQEQYTHPNEETVE